MGGREGKDGMELTCGPLCMTIFMTCVSFLMTANTHHVSILYLDEIFSSFVNLLLGSEG
jgi:hypothetical protein